MFIIKRGRGLVHTSIFFWAACFPSDPWNWVSFFPQPTVMNFPTTQAKTHIIAHTHTATCTQCLYVMHTTCVHMPNIIN